ncbi:carboxysome shell carbonic anhydrase [Ectothiorhodospira magna]|uniref:Carboxysome shell carbonic anhydrase n=2 Tax=Ectothiorhodospira magna TaxID=867345 RepID=A0A1H9ERC0_9GAMM|nr:carboxysome shell carbonic anhydrase [Ectothiorhodospira magna]
MGEAPPPHGHRLSSPVKGARSQARLHPLTDKAANHRLQAYETAVKSSFDRILPVLHDLAGLQRDKGFIGKAQALAEQTLGFRLPDHLLNDAWIKGLDLPRLHAACLFETYGRMADGFFAHDPLKGHDTREFDTFLQSCGFHLMDVTPCADGRLAHTISYVLRLPFGAVRRRSFAGALFDVEDTVSKWVEVEHARYRAGVPNTADAPTRYLKTVVYHFSSRNPAHEGCAAHGSDDDAAARAGLERLRAFRQAVENGFCCGASVALLLIGLDTDTDALRIHVPDAQGHTDLQRSLDTGHIYHQTLSMTPEAARRHILEQVRRQAPATPDEGMVTLIARLVENNLSQLDYVVRRHDGTYPDQGHAERFIGVGIGFEEIQLRNLTFFAYLHTVEEGAADLDVGCRILGGLNHPHGLPIPVVIRFDYHGQVPGARERAIARCQQVDRAVTERYAPLIRDGLLHRLLVVRDCDTRGGLERVATSTDPSGRGGH